jgi:hypothetical protein
MTAAIQTGGQLEVASSTDRNPGGHSPGWVELIQHDAHHRGQICLPARDLGHPFSGDDSMRMWGWKKEVEA